MNVIGKVPKTYGNDDLIVRMSREEWAMIVTGNKYEKGPVPVGVQADVHLLFIRQAELSKNRDRIDEAVEKLKQVIAAVEPIADVLSLPKEETQNAAS
ncbi:hypothetical protein VN12_26615 [Pirellula sp. SH-Sr6A]|uniref:hypothetical protein n=1 Tax=Pirellula sp. SH-Sr6A TaxID=1632865 RepID=UPI00078E24F3|nr:hypothetical protein [Pirellula sp. SH-Sr6A]AMV35694.1 hypothetical protein VN12_26615 [Pirellula sp. SH-Sr6A]